ncbi:DUF1648 domain-containing protein [Plantibacter sp. CFBP 8804]|uniref:DUF1648 domain-containing protein n=1 Tax=Plantibacter sp. CFBP 8804 TaxID=2775270 RepID=UPI001783B36D|nr:DUF1648 domain-containing protein [Plantibacter sp. CFBP 8804]MBD8517679.1 DUF1648 domain-containing protein [Plantibacter sp. CFBP 8804]
MQDPTIARPARPVRRPPVWPHLVALVIVAATLVIGLVVYPSAPDPMPVHFDAALQPDAWADKSIGGFLLPIIIGAVVVAIFWIIAACLPLTGTTRSDDGPHTSATASTWSTQLSPRPEVTAATTAATMRLLGDMSIATAALIAVVALTTWLGVPAWMAPWLLPVLMAGFFGSLAVSCVRVFRAQRRLG